LTEEEGELLAEFFERINGAKKRRPIAQTA
jgi:hypothetical protein